MCGICGQFNFLRGEKVHVEDLAAMTAAILHRGPDDQGFYTDGNLGLGFRRLSIIDLSGGHQPMSNRQKTVWVVFNGEIYNFQEVRKQLEARGYQFSTNSDTEVIVHGYEEWGDDVLDRLNGMFGLAIWDAKLRKLVLARDRMGIKPVYYSIRDGRLWFGSEIRALLAAPGGPRATIDPHAVESFLRYRYTPAPDTILEGVKKLAAGTRLIIEEGKQPRLERWWNFRPRALDPMPGVRDAEAQLLEIYSSAVKRHLISDVPVGLLLSGGMDSALLLALMSKVQGSWKTYSVGYGTTFVDDELRDAAETAKILGSSNVQVQISSSEFEANLEKVVAAVEEPVATSSVIPMYYVCQRAREEVTVALIGQGPDELFGGYKRHLGVRYGEYWRRLPKPVRSLLKATATIGRNETTRRAVYSLDVEDRLQRYQQVFSLLPDSSIQKLFRPEIADNIGDGMPGCWQELLPLMDGVDELGGLQFLEIRSSLPDELLLYADKLSMAHSLELRVPYLDQEVVEYAECLDASFKVHRGTRKRLHRLVARHFLPKEILQRKKRGFATNVVDEWLRSSVSRNMDTIFADDTSLVYGYLDPAAIKKMLGEHRAGRADHHKVLFSVVVLEHVLRHYSTHSASAPARNSVSEFAGAWARN
ncbi:MAG TPA: asparagine synthase (glutamine-hydrolyzing) [Terriglobales bacterium]|nr:asparagine synthase (glutamine-hydrolyzing) [Terriglobales bacterium]